MHRWKCSVLLFKSCKLYLDYNKQMRKSVPNLTDARFDGCSWLKAYSRPVLCFHSLAPSFLKGCVHLVWLYSFVGSLVMLQPRGASTSCDKRGGDGDLADQTHSGVAALGAYDYSARVVAHRPPEEYSLWNCLGYVFYAPLYLAGPILTFNAYISQVWNRERKKEREMPFSFRGYYPPDDEKSTSYG